MNVLEDTIIAVSTPFGHGGLGVVRLSGPESLGIARKLFKQKKRNKIRDFPRRLVFGNLFDFEKRRPFDEAYLAFFPGPNSYTREDMVELSSHGSPIILEEVVRLGLKAGARHAHPGEFTLRAYLHGRIDILQAEAVNDLIMASSLEQAKISFHQLGGRLSRKIFSLRSRLIRLLAQVEASIEFPDEALSISAGRISRGLETLSVSLRKLIESYQAGKGLREGITLAIVGKTNVGKSTLFNALLEKERAIVTPFPGTTRDYLEERLRIGNSFFRLIDMAGLGRPVHPVEEMGIRKGRKLAAESDGLLLVFDVSRESTPEDSHLLKKFKDKKTIIVFNKMDLRKRMDQESIVRGLRDRPWLEVSALEGKNLDKLREKIASVFVPSRKKGEETILHLRQKLILEEILGHVKKGLDLLKAGYSEDVYVEEIRKSLPLIGRMTGEVSADDVIRDIFSRFCVGK